MKIFSEIILMFHDIGQTVMGDVEEVDIGLNASNFEEVGADVFDGAEFVFGGFALPH